MAGQVVDQPHLPRLAEARGAAHQNTPHRIRGVSSSPFAVTHRLESSHAWICGATGLTGGDLLIHHGAEWLQTCRLLSSCMQQKIQMFGSLDRCTAGFEPVEGRDARFNQPTTQPTCLQNPRPNQKEEPTAYTTCPGKEGGGGESATSRVMSSTMSASDLKMAARMYRVIGHLGCNFESGGHIRDGTSRLPKILPKIRRSGKTLW